jgi:hypothetical protein
MWSSYFEFRYMMMSGAPGVRGPVSGLGFARVVGARWCACVMGAHVILPTNQVRPAAPAHPTQPLRHSSLVPYTSVPLPGEPCSWLRRRLRRFAALGTI